jgi:chemotaxis protein MotC
MSNGNAPRSILLMSDYLRRFGKSIYAWKLFRDFSEAVAKHVEFNGSDIVEKLTVATSAADKQSRIKLFIAMAAAALPPGHIALARAAASEALSLKPEGADDISRATLYEAAANAPTTRAAEALASLHRIPADHFSGGDTEMHEMAGYIARTIALDKIAENTAPSKGDEHRNAAGSLPSQDLSRVTSAIEEANAAIKAADKIMSGDMK